MVEKAVDFYFSDICVSFRALPNLTDEDKGGEAAFGFDQTGCSQCPCKQQYSDNTIKSKYCGTEPTDIYAQQAALDRVERSSHILTAKIYWGRESAGLS